MASRRFFNASDHCTTALASILHFLGSPFLIDDLEDCNDVRKVFLGVPTGVNRHVEVGLVRKLDLQGLRFFLGRDDVYLGHVRDGWPVAQLPFLALGNIQPVRSHEGGTHFGMLLDLAGNVGNMSATHSQRVKKLLNLG